jgi:hypothetical protein
MYLKEEIRNPPTRTPVGGFRCTHPKFTQLFKKRKRMIGNAKIFTDRGEISMNPDPLVPIVAFSLLTLLWIAFAAALVFNRAGLNRAWSAFRSTPLVAQILLALLTLPVLVGLWVWQLKWPGWLRLVLVAGLAWMTEYTFFPAKLF